MEVSKQTDKFILDLFYNLFNNSKFEIANIIAKPQALLNCLKI